MLLNIAVCETIIYDVSNVDLKCIHPPSVFKVYSKGVLNDSNLLQLSSNIITPTVTNPLGTLHVAYIEL